MPFVIRSTVLLLLLAAPCPGMTHGSVTADDDMCRIRVGYLTAHFKIYLPRTHQHQEFCEDLPRSGEAVFVLDYTHRDLSAMAVDFRIIRNVTGLGRFATQRDVDRIDDLESVTVFYQAARVENDALTVLHDFSDAGEYLGIITASDSRTQRVYSAVFPFEVNYLRLEKIPLFILLVLIVQLCYWMSKRSAHEN
ncbi:hypothetical protein F6455_01370 [Proteobacteria bacterium 005FR1]|nr:hypothetical protein [Proteobacteria bacterium 005FR1]